MVTMRCKGSYFREVHYKDENTYDLRLHLNWWIENFQVRKMGQATEKFVTCIYLNVQL